MPPGKQTASLTVQEPWDHRVLALALGNTHQCPPSLHTQVLRGRNYEEQLL